MSSPIALATPEYNHYIPDNPVNPLTRSALVNPPDPSSPDNYRLVPPLGLGYIASHARRHGHHVDLFDFSLDLAPGLEFLEKVGLFDRYDAYGFSTYSDTFSHTIECVRLVRQRCPAALIVLGGYHASLLHAEVIDDFAEVDIVVRNSGEEPFLELLHALSNNNLRKALANIAGVTWRNDDRRAVVNPLRTGTLNQDHLAFPVQEQRYRSGKYRTHVDAKRGSIKRTLNMVSSRGCPKRCTFCSIVLLNPLWRARSVESLIAEVSYNYTFRTFEHIAFQDANFFVNPKRSLSFAHALQDFNPDITWSGTATPDHVVRHAEVLDELGRLNCSYLELGIESGSDETLERFGKGTTVDVNERALALLERAGISVGLDFIMFEPEANLSDVRANLEFLLRNELFGEWPSEFLFQEMQLYPGTVGRERCAKKLGIRYAPHEVPPTPFFDPDVRSAFEAARAYHNSHQVRTNWLLKRLYEAVDSVLLSEQRDRVAGTSVQSLCQRAYRTIIRLRHSAFEFLVAACSKPADVSTYDCSSVVALHNEAALLLEEFRRVNMEYGIMPAFRRLEHARFI